MEWITRLPGRAFTALGSGLLVMAGTLVPSNAASATQGAHHALVLPAGRWYTVCANGAPNPYPFDFTLTKDKHSNSAKRSIRIAVTSAKSLYGTFLLEEGIKAPMLAEDPIFDKATVAAMKRVQRANGLPASGKIGPATWAALGEYCSLLH
jgi:peptidoglycan hydrolase-like protein with peptidoglycan-binding domain